MQQETNYAQLAALVDARDFEQAEAYCLHILATGGDQQFWRTQLGYVCFLNEEDVDAQYNRAPQAFQSLANEYPDDANAHFWFAYIIDVLMSQHELARQELEIVLRLVPGHVYANLALADLFEKSERIELLQRALSKQPTNFRVLHDLSELLIALGQITEALDVLQTMLSQSPYIETNYGIMNRYINGVLTGASREQEWRSEAKKIIADAEL